MPELPEIALYTKYAEGTALNKEIAKISFPNGKKLLQVSEDDCKKALLHKEFSSTDRLGKYLFLNTDKGKCLVLHFGMTGKLESYQHEEHPKNSEMIIEFKDSSKLSFVCRRKLGKIFLAEGKEEFQKEHELGPDALNLNWTDFKKLLQDKRGSIKGALMDQHLLAGLGNVYSDEILYQCGIHPKSKVEKLNEAEKKEIHKQMGKVLKMAIKEEGQRSEFPEDYLTPHRKEGEDCPKCTGKIEMIKVSGRSTYFCPKCQKEKS
ncbi:MAG: DNA-formamidopyrimidine glycosylase family protein [Salegentibacter sp.]